MNNFLLKLKIPNKNDSKYRTINPHKHWVYILYIFFVLLLCIIVFSLYLLFEIKNEQIFKDENHTKVEKSFIKEKTLKKVNESFDQKSQRTLNLNIEPIKIEDPSK